MKSYLFSLTAVTRMLVECFRRGSIEAGGILAGPRQSRIITDAVPSTEHAEREHYTYYQNDRDVEFLNRILRVLEKQGKLFLGYFHRHPSGMTSLSAGDLESCRRILLDPLYYLPSGLLMLILTESDDERLPIYPYLIHLEDERPVVEPVAMTVLPDSQVNDVLPYFDLASEPDANNKESHNEEVVCAGSGLVRPVVRTVRPGDRGPGYRQFDSARRTLQKG